MFAAFIIWTKQIWILLRKNICRCIVSYFVLLFRVRFALYPRRISGGSSDSYSQCSPESSSSKLWWYLSSFSSEDPLSSCDVMTDIVITNANSSLNYYRLSEVWDHVHSACSTKCCKTQTGMQSPLMTFAFLWQEHVIYYV